MTTQYVDQDIRRDEGYEADAYPDVISKGDPWTVGFGCTGEGIGPGTRWTLAQAVQQQVKRRQACEAQLDHAEPWWRQLSDVRQDVLTNMTYQMGIGGVSHFPAALEAMRSGNFNEAAVQMLDSDWARQTPSRAKRLAEQMRTGVRAGGLPAPAQTVAAVDPVAATKAAIGEA